MLKKWIASVLSLVLMLSALPVIALAEPTEPTAASAETSAEATAPETANPPEEKEESKEEEKKEETTKLLPLSAAQAAIPTHKLPTKAARIQRLRYYIQWDHQNALEQEDRESLYGFCGLLASYQMYYRGINRWRLCYDGKDNYDGFAQMGMTDGGYTIRAYNALKNPETAKETTEETKPETQEPESTAEPAETTAQPTEQTAAAQTAETTVPPETQPEAQTPETQEPETQEPETQEPETQEPEKYTIAEILNQVTNSGTKEVYNLLVCFERTNTQAGSVYGHVVFIYGIIDGVMYFTEGGNMFGAEAGTPMECTISQFSASYSAWTDFEGVIVFGCKEYLDNCKVYTSNLFASVTEPAPLQTMPNQEAAAEPVRIAAKGERLQVTSLYLNREGAYYYEVYDDGVVCYTPAQHLEPILFLSESYTVEGLNLPQALQQGKDIRLDGTVETLNYMSTVHISILDQNGEVVQKTSRLVNDSSYDLYDWTMNKALDFAALPEGLYTFRVDVQSSNWYMYLGYLAKRIRQETVVEQKFAVGEAVELPVPVSEEPVPTVRDGWVYENMTWYCYGQDTPLTGWQEFDGLKYYLKEDGSVSTGWTLVDGQLKLFTGTGAMRTGWVDTQMGRKYLLSDGTAALGWMYIDDRFCYFDELGVMRTDHVRTTLDRMSQLQTTLPADTQLPAEE